MPSLVSYWYDDPDAWDTCSLGVFVLPGLARVEIDRGIKLDVKTLPGQYGANITNMGNDPAKVDITVVVWLPDQWSAMQSILAALEVQVPKPTRRPQAYAIKNAIAQARGIQGVIVQNIVGPKDGAIPGAKEIVFKCIESLKPLKFPPVTPPLNLASRNNVVPVTPPSVKTPATP